MKQLKPLLCWLCILVASFTGPLFAQDSAVKHLDRESPELYQSFFFFCEEFSKWVEDLGTKEPERKADVVRAAAKYLRISSSEFAGLTQVGGAVADRVRKSREAAQSYAAETSRNHAEVNAAELRRHDTERLSAIQDGISGVQRVLSPGSWEALHRYINEEHRLHTRVFDKAQ